jgi:hypothetical protein
VAHHAAITFLEDQESLKGVDLDFRKLVEIFHQIPFCASFGVSYSGHFTETDGNDKWRPNSFHPSPWGHLDFIVLPTIPHIQEFLQIIREVVDACPDVSLKKIKHVFGPPENSQLEVWEIRTGDNGCLGDFREKVLLGSYLTIKSNEALYEKSKKRCAEIKTLWKNLEETVFNFCQEYGFKDFSLEERIREIVSIWETEIKNK